MDLVTLKNLYDASPFGFACHKVVYSPNGAPEDYTYIYINPVFESMAGLSCSQVLNQPVTKVRSGEFDWMDYYGKIASEGRQEVFEYYSRPLGRWYKAHAYPIGSEYFGTVFLDITEEKQPRDVLKNVLKAIPDMISVHDADMNVLFSNWSGFGDIPEEKRTLGAKCYRIYRGFDTICPDCQARRVLQTKQLFQTEVKLPDGTWVDLRVVPILNAHGDCMYFAEWVRVITDRKKMELELQQKNMELNASYEELEAMNEELLSSNEALIEAKSLTDAANGAKNQFLANMSHELRTPLNGVIGFSELLQYSLLDESQKEYVGYILQSGKNLLDIVAHLLEFIDAQSDTFRLLEEGTDLKELCQKTMELVRFQAHQKGLALSCDIEPILAGKWMVDPMRLQEVLLNLLGNAVKFTHQGNVRARISAPQPPTGNGFQTIRISVEDTGIGIDPAFEKKIFQAFEQADMSHTRRYGGTGMGLPITQEILKRMKSTLQYESRLGKGTIFFFDLCLQREPDTSRSTASEAGSKESQSSLTRKMVVLVVEDDFVNAQLLRAFLEKCCPDAQIQQAQSGEDAVAAYPDLLPDLVLMDIQMPGIDGFEATRQIRQIEIGMNKRARVIAVTAAVEERHLLNWRSAGMDDYLLKPLDFAETQAKMRKWIRS